MKRARIWSYRHYDMRRWFPQWVLRKHVNISRRIWKTKLRCRCERKILEFVELDETELVDFGKDIRIVLASSDFSKELTTTAIWLRDKGVDIRCVRLTPYRFNDDVLINAEQIIPVPELEEYQVKFREKRDEQLISSQKKRRTIRGIYIKIKNLINVN